MRVELRLAVTGEERRLPLSYQYELSSWIYWVLGKGDAGFAGWLHDEGYGAEHDRLKLFTFSNLRVGRYAVKGDRLVLRSREVGLVVSFLSGEGLEVFERGLERVGLCVLGDWMSRVSLEVVEARRCAEVALGREAVSRTLSPVFMDERLGNGRTWHLRPGEGDFERLLYRNLVEKYRALGGEGPLEEGFRFELLDGLKEKVITIKRFKRGETRFRAYLCRFRLAGDPGLLRVAYDGGVGRLNSQGFGCVEVEE